MAGYLFFGVLAAFGALCVLWGLLGWLLPGERGGAVVCRCGAGLKEEFFLRRCLWLRHLGMLKAPLLVVDDGLTCQERAWLERCRGVEFCSLEELPARLELERNGIE